MQNEVICMKQDLKTNLVGLLWQRKVIGIDFHFHRHTYFSVCYYPKVKWQLNTNC